MALLATIGTAYGIQALCAAFAIPLQTEKYVASSPGILRPIRVGYVPKLHGECGSGIVVPCRFVSDPAPPAEIAPRPCRYTIRRCAISCLSTPLSPCHPWLASIVDNLSCPPSPVFGLLVWAPFCTSGLKKAVVIPDSIRSSAIPFSSLAPGWPRLRGSLSPPSPSMPSVNSLPASRQPPFGVTGSVGTGLWLASFLFEVVADQQKSKWREEKLKKIHSEEFISRGLWSISRHPNYVGEVMLWASQVMIGWTALPVWMRLMSCLSPILEYLLITKVSGVPLLEEKADKQFKENPAYQAYKARTPVFWPKLSSS
ncbi:hypothetical protein VP01_1005g1 [Puccinia sorghi]|uniref:Uncharacterized protein n=1 Tax=Puccinia sorghi TaxID=27349 RepID=A0A0L6VV64_9BASI|nr:hypothetical protein VP01_1005g1 [Puccinia sorghi]